MTFIIIIKTLFTHAGSPTLNIYTNRHETITGLQVTTNTAYTII
jgi:hypothetical protein